MDDLDKTQMGLRAYMPGNDVSDVTMPGKRDRKPDGRFEPGDLIMHRYKVLAELGQGGMGVVYKCFDETAGIEVALKALPPELSHNTLEMEDIKENFQLVSKLVHQNIAISKNLELDNSNGNYYLIMECIEGEDVRHWLKRKRKEGVLTLEAILPVIRQVATALDYAHKEKIIHRDIKPGNIMISADGDAKILDFGLAAQIHTSMTRVSVAYHGTSGTGPYMAPEQWRGRAQGAPADQYALAVMTYEMLAGRLPFEATDPAVLREAVLNEKPDAIDGIAISTNQAILRAMSKEPAKRFASCSDFIEALTNGQYHKREKSWIKRKWLISIFAFLLFIGGAIIVFPYRTKSISSLKKDFRIPNQKSNSVNTPDFAEMEQLKKNLAAEKQENEKNRLLREGQIAYGKNDWNSAYLNAQKVLSLDKSNIEAKYLLEKAVKNLNPSLKINAFINGKAVPATVIWQDGILHADGDGYGGFKENQEYDGVAYYLTPEAGYWGKVHYKAVKGPMQLNISLMRENIIHEVSVLERKIMDPASSQCIFIGKLDEAGDFFLQRNLVLLGTADAKLENIRFHVSKGNAAIFNQLEFYQRQRVHDTIAIEDGGSATILNCYFEGSGIRCGNDSRVIISKTTIADAVSGGIICEAHSSAEIAECAIHNPDHNGIILFDQAAVNMKQCELAGAVNGAAIYLMAPKNKTKITLTNCSVFNCDSGIDGIGGKIELKNTPIKNCKRGNVTVRSQIINDGAI